MNIYDAAHNLSRAIKNSNEYRDFVEKRKLVASNTKAKGMLEDFRSKAMELQMEQMSGKAVDQGKADELKKIELVLMDNPIIREYFNVEMRFSQVMSDVYKIIGESIDVQEDK